MSQGRHPRGKRRAAETPNSFAGCLKLRGGNAGPFAGCLKKLGKLRKLERRSCRLSAPRGGPHAQTSRPAGRDAYLCSNERVGPERLAGRARLARAAGIGFARQNGVCAAKWDLRGKTGFAPQNGVCAANGICAAKRDLCGTMGFRRVGEVERRLDRLVAAMPPPGSLARPRTSWRPRRLQWFARRR